MKPFTSAGAALLCLLATTARAIQFDPENEASIRAATKQYAYGLMSLYPNNATDTDPQNVGTFNKPYYWWEGGAAWGGMIEYSQITGDPSHVKTLQQALTANYGPDKDFILSYRQSETGNDDQAFWALAVMSALEYGFPEAENAPASYLDVAVNTFNNIVGRWDETSCGGGLKWQIYPANSYGYDYKNSISNACAFALGARLARYTGEQKYADWASKIYDWTTKVGLVSDQYEVYDGTSDKTNCDAVSDKTQWTYNSAMFMHGSAVMYDYTKGDSTWKDRTSGFLNHAQSMYFSPYDNATNVMYESACETGETGRHCNLDQQSFKSYLARFMAKTALLVPSTKDSVTQYLKSSAVGAAKSCSGPNDSCGAKWYTGSYDNAPGVGQQLSALEVTQSLLLLQQGTLPAKSGQSSKSSGSSEQEGSTSTSPSSSAVIDVSSSSGPSQTAAATATATNQGDSVSLTMVGAPAPSSATSKSHKHKGHKTASAGPETTSDAEPTGKAGGEFGQLPDTTCTTGTTTKTQYTSSCEPTTTVTVYGPPPPSTMTTSCTPTTTLTVYAGDAPTTPAAPTLPAVPTLPTIPTGTALPSGTIPLLYNGTGNGTYGAPPAMFTGAATKLGMEGYSAVGLVAALIAGLL